MIINSHKQSQIDLVSAQSARLEAAPEASRNFQASQPQKSHPSRKSFLGKGEKNSSVFNIKKITTSTNDKGVTADMPEIPQHHRGSLVEAKEFSLDDALGVKQMRTSWYSKKTQNRPRHMQSQPAQHLNSSQYTSSTNKTGITTVRVHNADLVEDESEQSDSPSRFIVIPQREKVIEKSRLLIQENSSSIGKSAPVDIKRINNSKLVNLLERYEQSAIKKKMVPSEVKQFDPQFLKTLKNFARLPHPTRPQKNFLTQVHRRLFLKEGVDPAEDPITYFKQRRASKKLSPSSSTDILLTAAPKQQSPNSPTTEMVGSLLEQLKNSSDSPQQYLAHLDSIFKQVSSSGAQTTEETPVDHLSQITFDMKPVIQEEEVKEPDTRPVSRATNLNTKSFDDLQCQVLLQKGTAHNEEIIDQFISQAPLISPQPHHLQQQHQGYLFSFANTSPRQKPRASKKKSAKKKEKGGRKFKTRLLGNSSMDIPEQADPMLNILTIQSSKNKFEKHLERIGSKLPLLQQQQHTPLGNDKINKITLSTPNMSPLQNPIGLAATENPSTLHSPLGSKESIHPQMQYVKLIDRGQELPPPLSQRIQSTKLKKQKLESQIQRLQMLESAQNIHFSAKPNQIPTSGLLFPSQSQVQTARESPDRVVSKKQTSQLQYESLDQFATQIHRSFVVQPTVSVELQTNSARNLSEFPAQELANRDIAKLMETPPFVPPSLSSTNLNNVLEKHLNFISHQTSSSPSRNTKSKHLTGSKISAISNSGTPLKGVPESYSKKIKGSFSQVEKPSPKQPAESSSQPPLVSQPSHFQGTFSNEQSQSVSSQSQTALMESMNTSTMNGMTRQQGFIEIQREKKFLRLKEQGLIKLTPNATTTLYNSNQDDYPLSPPTASSRVLKLTSTPEHGVFAIEKQQMSDGQNMFKHLQTLSPDTAGMRHPLKPMNLEAELAEPSSTVRAIPPVPSQKLVKNLVMMKYGKNSDIVGVVGSPQRIKSLNAEKTFNVESTPTQKEEISPMPKSRDFQMNIVGSPSIHTLFATHLAQQKHTIQEEDEYLINNRSLTREHSPTKASKQSAMKSSTEKTVEQILQQDEDTIIPKKIVRKNMKTLQSLEQKPSQHDEVSILDIISRASSGHSRLRKGRSAKKDVELVSFRESFHKTNESLQKKKSSHNEDLKVVSPKEAPVTKLQAKHPILQQYQHKRMKPGAIKSKFHYPPSIEVPTANYLGSHEESRALLRDFKHTKADEPLTERNQPSNQAKSFDFKVQGFAKNPSAEDLLPPSGAVSGSFGGGSPLAIRQPVIHKLSVDKQGKIKVEQSKRNSLSSIPSKEQPLAERTDRSNLLRPEISGSKLKQKEMEYFKSVYDIEDKLEVVLKTRNILKNLYHKSIKDRTPHFRPREQFKVAYKQPRLVSAIKSLPRHSPSPEVAKIPTPRVDGKRLPWPLLRKASDISSISNSDKQLLKGLIQNDPSNPALKAALDQSLLSKKDSLPDISVSTPEPDEDQPSRESETSPPLARPRVDLSVKGQSFEQVKSPFEHGRFPLSISASLQFLHDHKHTFGHKILAKDMLEDVISEHGPEEVGSINNVFGITSSHNSSQFDQRSSFFSASKLKSQPNFDFQKSLNKWSHLKPDEESQISDAGVKVSKQYVAQSIQNKKEADWQNKRFTIIMKNYEEQLMERHKKKVELYGILSEIKEEHHKRGSTREMPEPTQVTIPTGQDDASPIPIMTEGLHSKLDHSEKQLRNDISMKKLQSANTSEREIDFDLIEQHNAL